MWERSAFSVLLVEDDPGHARLIEKNLRRTGFKNEIITLENGQDAIDFLFRVGEFANDKRPTPLMILLDLNMPIKDGYQVLQEIKADERTRHIPVVMLTTTNNPMEVARCYELGCNIYISKPVEYDQFSDTIRSLGVFLSMVQTPNEADLSHPAQLELAPKGESYDDSSAEQ